MYAAKSGIVTFKGDVLNSEGHSSAVSLLASKEVTHVISGGMGQHARDILQEQGIESILGVQGEIETVARGFFEGSISNSAPLCTHSGCSNPDEQVTGSCTSSYHQQKR